MFKVNNKETDVNKVVPVSLLLTWKILTPFSTIVPIVGFDQVGKCLLGWQNPNDLKSNLAVSRI